MCAIRNILLRIPLGKDWWTRRKSFLTASPIWQNESEQGLKPYHSYACAARLKPCPDTKHQGGDSRKPRVSSGTLSLKCRNSRPRTASWAKFSRPFGTHFAMVLTRFRNGCRPKPRVFSWFSPRENHSSRSLSGTLSGPPHLLCHLSRGKTL